MNTRTLYTRENFVFERGEILFKKIHCCPNSGTYTTAISRLDGKKEKLWKSWSTIVRGCSRDDLNDFDRWQSPDGYDLVDWHRTSWESYDAPARAQISIQLWPLEWIAALYNCVKRNATSHRYASKGPCHGHDRLAGKRPISWRERF